jgi:hypothetical protein
MIKLRRRLMEEHVHGHGLYDRIKWKPRYNVLQGKNLIRALGPGRTTWEGAGIAPYLFGFNKR